MASKRCVSTDTVMGSIMMASHQPTADVDLGRERAVHRALAGDLEQPTALLAVQRAGQLQLDLDPVEPAPPPLPPGAAGAGAAAVPRRREAAAPPRPGGPDPPSSRTRRSRRRGCWSGPAAPRRSP